MTVRGSLKRSFISGMILITPLVLTAYILNILANWSFQFVNPVVRETRLTNYTGNIEALAQVIALVLIIAAVTVLGYVAQKSIGRHVFGNIGRIVNVIPLVSTIYSSVRQVANSLVERNTAYESVVLVEYPREGVYSIGLVTGESPRAVKDHVGEDVYNVFLPNSPNPTGGRLVMLPEHQVDEIDMSVRRGMGLLVTTGMAESDDTAEIPESQHVPERVSDVVSENGSESTAETVSE